MATDIELLKTKVESVRDQLDHVAQNFVKGVNRIQELNKVSDAGIDSWPTFLVMS